MTLISEIGNPNMNSYVSLDEAYEYFSNRSHSEAWEDIDDIDIYESFLITGTNIIDWYLTFQGSKKDQNQSLEWPRKDAYDKKRKVIISSDIIPKEIKKAVFELTLSSLQSDRTADSDMIGLEKVKIGTLEIVSNSSGVWQDSKSTIPDIIYRILDGLIYESGEGSMFKYVVRT